MTIAIDERVDVWICSWCGARCERPPTRGQRPKWCDECRRLRPWARRSRCPQCGEPRRDDNATCSRLCAHLAAGGAASQPLVYSQCAGGCDRQRSGPVHRHWMCRRCTARHRRDSPRRSHRVWVSGRCRRCGTTFTTYVTRDHVLAAWCSTACHRLDQKATARAREAGAPVETFARWRVFEEHGWWCHICNHPIDPSIEDVLHPMYATLDHVVPLGPDGAHAASNLRPAHRVCNAIKGDAYEGSPF